MLRAVPHRGLRWPWLAAAAAVVLAVGAAAAVLATRGGGGPAVPPTPPPWRVSLVYAAPVGHDLFAPQEMVYRASRSGAHPVRLGHGVEPLLSPDGRFVAYRMAAPRRELTGVRVLSFDGGPTRTLADATGALAWSPDSRLLAVTSTHGPAVVNVRSSRWRPLPPLDGEGCFSFSPDGTQLAFARGSDIYTVSIQNHEIRRLTDDHRSGFPLWGPAGIAFERFTAQARGDVWLMDGGGGHQRQLTHTHAGIYPAAWSADGSRLLAAYPATHNGRLYAVDVATGRTQALTPFVGDLFPQGLSRDGRTVLAAIGCGGTAGLTGILETIPFAGGPPKTIVRGPCRGSWNA
jgi:WD40 repeat protein